MWVTLIKEHMTFNGKEKKHKKQKNFNNHSVLIISDLNYSTVINKF